MASNNSGLAKILAIIGGILVLADGVLSLLNVLLSEFNLGFNIPGAGGFYSFSGLINSIIVIAIGFFILIATGTIKSSKSNVKFNGVTVIILGIIALIFGGYIGPILVIIAGILLLVR